MNFYQSKYRTLSPTLLPDRYNNLNPNATVMDTMKNKRKKSLNHVAQLMLDYKRDHQQTTKMVEFARDDLTSVRTPLIDSESVTFCSSVTKSTKTKT